MHVCPSQQKGVLIGARQTEDHWKPPDRESVGAKAQDKVSVRPEGWAGRSVRCPGKKGTDAASPTLDARAPGCSRSSLCGQDVLSRTATGDRRGRGMQAAEKLVNDRTESKRERHWFPATPQVVWGPGPRGTGAPTLWWEVQAVPIEMVPRAHRSVKAPAGPHGRAASPHPGREPPSVAQTGAQSGRPAMHVTGSSAGRRVSTHNSRDKILGRDQV